MEIKTKLFLITDVFILMSTVLFMSSTSIKGSCEVVLYCSTPLWVIALDYIVSPTIINTDTWLLSISGTCRAGSKDGAPDNYSLC